MLLGYKDLKLEDTLEFIEINCKVIGIEKGYIAFRVDYDIQIIPFICKKQKDISDSARSIIESKFYKQK